MNSFTKLYIICSNKNDHCIGTISEANVFFLKMLIENFKHSQKWREYYTESECATQPASTVNTSQADMFHLQLPPHPLSSLVCSITSSRNTVLTLSISECSSEAPGLLQQYRHNYGYHL